MTSTPILTQPASLSQYLEGNWQLIPLHRYDTTDTFKGRLRQRGKSPVDGKWTTAIYKNEDQLAHIKKGFNVGVRLTAKQLVVDVDPRNFGPTAETKDLPKEQWVLHTLDTPGNPFAQLCVDCGIDPDTYPVVETGSGGLHVYMTKPDDISVKDSHPDYPGIEFKTLGRQVVSAGSVHPDTKRVYSWGAFCADLKAIKPAPKFLLDIIARPKAQAQLAGGGEYTAEQIEQMLDALNPEDFQDYTEWLTLMQACHYASHGEARIEFVEWSISDPAYANAATEVGQKWDSFHTNKPGAKVTTNTLHKIMHKAGKAEAIPRRGAAEDFPDDNGDIDDVVMQLNIDEGLVDPDDPKEVQKVEARTMPQILNEKYTATMDGGKFRIYKREKDVSFDPPREYWATIAPYDFKEYYGNWKYQEPNSDAKLEKLGDYWLTWKGRNTKKGIVFDPGRDHKGYLNLWTGWAYNARRKEGGWSYLDDLIKNTLAAGDMAVYEYILNWCAYMFQHPSRPAEVAIAFQGDKGTGKGTLGRTLTALAGPHGLAISSASHFTGRFNAHLRDVVMLFADEAVKTKDENAKSQLKALITEPVLAFEGKGANLVSGKNHLHIMIASNEDKFVPAGDGDGERRYVIQKVLNNRQGDHEFFKKLNHQLERQGGREAFLWDMTQRDLGEWHPRTNLPVTKALVEQQWQEATITTNWWMEVLKAGRFKHAEPCVGDYVAWKDEPIRVFVNDFKADFWKYYEEGTFRNDRSIKKDHAFEIAQGREFHTLIPDYNPRQRVKVPEDWYGPDGLLTPDQDGRARAVQLPSLSDCRAAMDKRNKLKNEWD